MSSLHLLVHADSPETAARIERALHAGAPDFTVQVVPGSALPPAAVLRTGANGLVTAATVPGDSVAPPTRPGMASSIRHELNNHLGIIRMLADYLVADHNLPAAAAAKVQEIGNAAEAAAQVVRRTKPPV